MWSREVDCNYRYCGEESFSEMMLGCRPAGTMPIYQGTKCSSERTGSRKGWAWVSQAQQGALCGWSRGRRGELPGGQR